MHPDEIIISVCIITLGRPEGLRRLLDSLVRQEAAPAFEVVVVDNDAAGTARSVAEEFRTALNLVYTIEPRRGLSYARNRAVQSARGECLAFIDDDESASPRWLATLHRVLEHTGAACVFGPVRIEFDEETPLAIRTCRLFRRPAYAEGQAVPWFHTRTSNAVIRRSALPSAAAPFDLHFNRTGGEDVDLFKRVIDRGGRAVAAGAGAEVVEQRAFNRGRVRWVLARSIRNGGNLADHQWAHLSRRERSGRAVVAGFASIGQFAEAFRLRREKPSEYIERCIDAGENLGRFLHLFGYRHAEYGSRR
mgnify:CR=1 FL=1